MSDENTPSEGQSAPQTSEPAQAPAQTHTPPPKAPSLDVDRFVQEAGEKLEKQVAKRMQAEREELAKRITGVQEEPPPNPTLVELAKDPDSFFEARERASVDKAKQEILAEQEAARKQEEFWTSTKAPFTKEIPDLEKHEPELIFQMQAIVRENPEIDFNNLMKEAVDRTVSKHGLSRLSEEDQKRREAAMFAPGPQGSGYPTPPPSAPDPIKSSQDYVSQLRAEAKRMRNFHGRHKD